MSAVNTEPPAPDAPNQTRSRSTRSRPTRSARTAPSTRPRPPYGWLGRETTARLWRANARRETTPVQRSGAALPSPHFLPRGVRRTGLTAARRDLTATALRLAPVTRGLCLPRFAAIADFFAAFAGRVRLAACVALRRAALFAAPFLAAPFLAAPFLAAPFLAAPFLAQPFLEAVVRPA